MVEVGAASACNKAGNRVRFPLEGFVALYLLMYLPNVIITRLVTSTVHR